MTDRFQPIIYVRGYAMSQGEVDDTVADPYMGFNLGSTKTRTANSGNVEKLFFESPVIRLMKDFKYLDVYSSGQELHPDRAVERNSIIIFRYYDRASSDFGDSSVIPIEDYARDLFDLMVAVERRILAAEPKKSAPPRPVRFNLVAHSMGGLVVRTMLQNDAIGTRAEKARLVDKVFTYATPHNGIDVKGMNVPSFLSQRGLNTFNRKRMAEFLGLSDPELGPDKAVNTLAGKFDATRFFCLVGTNAADYTAGRGLSSWGVGPASDGLVTINNAAVWGRVDTQADGTKIFRDQAPRAFVHRSHSGHYGIVNSEEGYQSLVRFLFGDVRIDGELEVRDIPLPKEVEEKRAAGKSILASYNFEVVAAVRGMRWDLSRRLVSENSAVFRKFDDLFPSKADGTPRAAAADGWDTQRRPLLFTFFLSKAARVDDKNPSLGFSVDFGVLVPEYEVEGSFFNKNHFPGGYIYRDKINLIAIQPKTKKDSWTLHYGFDSETPNDVKHTAKSTVKDKAVVFHIPIQKTGQPGIDATLHLTARPWNDGSPG